MPWAQLGGARNQQNDPVELTENNWLGTQAAGTGPQTNPAPLIIRTNGVERLRVAPTGFGNVGIGTTNPQSLTGGRTLHIDNQNPRAGQSNASALRLGADDAQRGEQWEWQSTVITRPAPFNDVIGAMNLSKAASSRFGAANPLTVLANGNVGIGTTAP